MEELEDAHVRLAAAAASDARKISMAEGADRDLRTDFAADGLGQKAAVTHLICLLFLSICGPGWTVRPPHSWYDSEKPCHAQTDTATGTRLASILGARVAANGTSLNSGGRKQSSFGG
jgi:hypothetical protein